MKNNVLRKVVRAIVTEAFEDDVFGHDEFGHSTNGKLPLKKNEFDFPVWDSEDQEYTVSAVYDERRPFDIELWQAVGPNHEEVDIKDLEKIIPDLKARAFDWIRVDHSDH